jgi:SPP1 gp7 family putative phage head morphogenesis protein
LLESTFGDDVLNDENMVHLVFAEIDLLNKIDMENHAVELFKANGLTYSEFRSSLSKEPIPLPEDPENQDMSQYPEWSETAWKLFDEPMNLIRAVDEPYGAAAQALASARSTSVTSQALQKQQTAQENAMKVEAEQDKQAKIAVARARPVARKDSYLSTAFSHLESDSIERLRSGLLSRGNFDRDYILSISRAWVDNTTDHMISTIFAEILKGFNDFTGYQSSRAGEILQITRDLFKQRLHYRLSKIVEFVVNLISSRVDSINSDVKLVETQNEFIKQLHIAFDTVRYRIDFIWDSEIRKSYNYGKVLGMRFLNSNEFTYVANANACESCLSIAGKTFNSHSTTIDDVIPHHSNCKCEFSIKRP